jgi:trimeric autotransporter adhesin
MTRQTTPYLVRRVLILLTLVCAAMRAQSGTVKFGGQPVPGATVVASQGERRVLTTTDDAGRYEFTNLAPGAYTIEVQMFGFQRMRKQAQIAATAQPLDFTLDLQARSPQLAQRMQQQGGFRASQDQGEQPDASLNEPPVPNSGAPLDTSTEAFLVQGTVSNTLQNGQDDFGLRGPQDFRGQFGLNGGVGPDGQPLQPGQPGEAGQQPGAGTGGRFGGGGGPGGGGFGGRGGGGGGPGGRGGGPGGQRPNRPGGPGGNGTYVGNRANRGQQRIQGQASFTLANSAIDARPFSLTGQAVPQASFAQARGTLSLGGPLRIPKIWQKDTQTFFFINYAFVRAKNPYKNAATVPTALERSGNFSESVTNTPVTIFDPTNNAPFAGNLIPISRQNTAALGLLKFIPLPNQPGLVQNYQILTSVPQNSDTLAIRLNQNITKRDRVALNLNIQRRDGNPAQLYGFDDTTSGTGISTNLSYTRNLGVKTLSVLTFAFNRNRNDTLPFFANKDDVAAQLGIRGTATDPINFGPPNLSFTNFGNLTDASASLSRIQSASISENVSTVKGAHNITTGISFRRTQLNVQTDSNARGTFAFTGLSTSQFDASGNPIQNTGFDLADFLLGLPQSASVRFGDTSTYFRGNQYGAFAQDDWRIRPNFSLNLGLRYEYFTPLTEKYGHIANLDIAPGFTAVAVVTPGVTAPYAGSLPSALMRPDKNNFAPREAIAWKPLPKSTRFKSLQVRAGYGIYYNPSVYNSIASKLAAQPPFAQTQTLSTSLADVLTLQNGLATHPGQEQILNTFAVDPNYRVGYAQTWNTNVQTDLPHSLILDIGYLGTKGTRLDIQRLPNRAAPGSPLTAEQRRQIGNATGFTYESSEGNSIYHAMQVRIARRMRRGLGINALYTFGKSIDNSSTFGGAGNTVAQNDKDLRAERGLSSFDHRHTFNLTSTFSSPNRNNKWLKDWTMQGMLTFATGSPLTARVLGNVSDTGGTGSVGSGRADATGQPVSCCGLFFNPAAFTIPLNGTFGNAGRNTIEGPNNFSINSSLSRSIPLSERRRVEFRLEATNLTNHVNYTNVFTVVNASNFGLPSAAGPMRTLQINVRFRF